MRKVLADQLLQKAKDLMVFAGLIKYKLPPRVFKTLAREGQEVGLSRIGVMMIDIRMLESLELTL